MIYYKKCRKHCSLPRSFLFFFVLILRARVSFILLTSAVRHFTLLFPYAGLGFSVGLITTLAKGLVIGFMAEGLRSIGFRVWDFVSE